MTALSSVAAQPLVEIHPDRESWEASRRRSLGSSDIPHLLGATCPGGTRGLLDLWLEKNPAAQERLPREAPAEEPEAPSSTINWAARLAMEPLIQRMLEEERGLLIVDPGDFAILRSAEKPWLHVSPDGLVVIPDAQPVHVPAGQLVEKLFSRAAVETFAEYKTISPFAAWKWSPEEPDLYAVLQVHHTLAMPEFAGCSGAHIGAFVGYGDSPSDRLVYDVERDERLVALIQEATEQFHGWIASDTPPPVDGRESTTHALRLLYPAKTKGSGVQITLGAQFVAQHVEHRRLRDDIDALERRRKQIQQEIEWEMGQVDAETAFIPASTDLPQGGRWVRYETTRKPTLCTCGELIHRGSTYTTCRPVKE